MQFLAPAGDRAATEFFRYLRAVAQMDTWDWIVNGCHLDGALLAGLSVGDVGQSLALQLFK